MQCYDVLWFNKLCSAPQTLQEAQSSIDSLGDHCSRSGFCADYSPMLVVRKFTLHSLYLFGFNGFLWEEVNDRIWLEPALSSDPVIELIASIPQWHALTPYLLHVLQEFGLYETNRIEGVHANPNNVHPYIDFQIKRGIIPQ